MRALPSSAVSALELSRVVIDRDVPADLCAELCPQTILKRLERDLFSII